MKLLFARDQIAERITILVDTLMCSPPFPTVMVPILTGAFMFAADLARALERRGILTPVNFLWLQRDSMLVEGVAFGGSYVRFIAGPQLEDIERAHVLLVDGVLDSGSTIERAEHYLRVLRPASITTAVVVDKMLSQASRKADFACFVGDPGFIVGYGMDSNGKHRCLPDIMQLESDDHTNTQVRESRWV